LLKLLFVYGTLMKGEKNHALLVEAGGVRMLGPGRSRGVLHDLGDFPGFVAGGRNWVAGEVYRFEDPDRTLSSLDLFEVSAGFERRLLSVRWQHGEEDIWAYVYTGPLDNARMISGGSYKARNRKPGRPSGRKTSSEGRKVSGRGIHGKIRGNK
jgi:gamma-glutamylcyclotransferase (GGCT)/AIG2-like uncharacterized protein YtfP